ncbi:MAG: hypothetical protein KGI66_05170 [Patescibacteria group bacterium]|nr:hypothetical protein [Patescibacteria group bacterium]
MNDLSKQQLILLALLVSFVTSLATGIVTVCLMDQAPAGVTRTVSQVIEKTIREVAPQSAAVAESAPAPAQAVAEAVRTASASLVVVEDAGSKAALGLGLVVTGSGDIITVKKVTASARDYAALLPDGTVLPVSVTMSQDNGDIVFLAPSVETKPKISFAPAILADSISLGDGAISLSGTSTLALGQGLIDGAGSASTSALLDGSSSPITVSMGPEAAPEGSFLFDMSGRVLGVMAGAPKSGSEAVFYPISAVKAAIETR